MSITPSGIIDISGYQDQLDAQYTSRLPNTPDSRSPRQKPAGDTVNISRRARELQQVYQGEKMTLEQTYQTEAQALEREYSLEKNKLEREFARKKQSLEIDVLA